MIKLSNLITEKMWPQPEDIKVGMRFPHRGKTATIKDIRGIWAIVRYDEGGISKLPISQVRTILSMEKLKKHKHIAETLMTETTVNLMKVGKDNVKVSKAARGSGYEVTHFMKFLQKNVGVEATKLGPGEWLIHYRSHPALADAWDKKKVGDEWTVTI